MSPSATRPSPISGIATCCGSRRRSRLQRGTRARPASHVHRPFGINPPALARTSSSRPQATIFPSPSTTTAWGIVRTAKRPKRLPQALVPSAAGDVDADGELEVQGVDHLADLGRLAPRRVDADRPQAIAAARPGELVEPHEVVAAGVVPLGPEAEDHDLAAEGLPGRGLAVQPCRCPGKLGRGLADQGIDRLPARLAAPGAAPAPGTRAPGSASARARGPRPRPAGTGRRIARPRRKPDVGPGRHDHVAEHGVADPGGRGDRLDRSVAAPVQQDPSLADHRPRVEAELGDAERIPEPRRDLAEVAARLIRSA